MAVPDTTTFSLNDVRLELGLGSTTSLQSCFLAANPAFFDPTYEGSKNSLLNFRNYGASSPTTPVWLGRDVGSPAVACTIGTTLYYLPAGQTWNTATAIYADEYGTTPAPGGYWYSNQSTYRRWEDGILGGQISCP